MLQILHIRSLLCRIVILLKGDTTQKLLCRYTMPLSFLCSVLTYIESVQRASTTITLWLDLDMLGLYGYIIKPIKLK